MEKIICLTEVNKAKTCLNRISGSRPEQHFQTELNDNSQSDLHTKLYGIQSKKMGRAGGVWGGRATQVVVYSGSKK